MITTAKEFVGSKYWVINHDACGITMTINYEEVSLSKKEIAKLIATMNETCVLNWQDKPLVYCEEKGIVGSLLAIGTYGYHWENVSQYLKHDSWNKKYYKEILPSIQARAGLPLQEGNDNIIFCTFSREYEIDELNLYRDKLEKKWPRYKVKTETNCLRHSTTFLFIRRD